ncbi:MAG: hypothetical protein JOZ58_19940, partial [Acetobacteraceae bacterium]|nr:hypothetical protein [Acetobacteraceae bacterium]
MLDRVRSESGLPEDHGSSAPPEGPTPAEAPRSARMYLSGVQALVQLPILQRQRDLEAGLDTAGFISGYRGSPLGNLDQALWREQKR